ncbi:bactofilin family protein [Shewanella sp. Shew256]|uniref:bactofilin family protein n=1 Tax=Shewanella sp. Shew256 TaxID=1969376 RepID=UPI000B4A096F|nr:polymer-forming cytoskeletal protein [Shewanella sp. Shew256]
MGSKGNGVTFISASTSIEGEMQLAGTALVAGKLAGNIRCAGQIKIELGGEVSGELCCDELKVCGVFRGKVRCNKLVIVSSGTVEGEVLSHQLEIYEGGQFIGQRIIGQELEHLPELLQTLAPEGAAKNTNTAQTNALYARDNQPGARKWLPYGAAAAAIIVLVSVITPVKLTTWLSTFGQPAAITANTAQGDALNSETLLPSPVKDDSLAKDSGAASDNDTQTASAMALDSHDGSNPEHPSEGHPNMESGVAMEDLAQMEQGHAQMLQQGTASDVPSGKL